MGCAERGSDGGRPPHSQLCAAELLVLLPDDLAAGLAARSAGRRRRWRGASHRPRAQVYARQLVRGGGACESLAGGGGGGPSPSVWWWPQPLWSAAGAVTSPHRPSPRPPLRAQNLPTPFLTLPTTAGAKRASARRRTRRVTPCVHPREPARRCNEFARWCPRLKVQRLAGDVAERSAVIDTVMKPGLTAAERGWNVLMTTYEVAGAWAVAQPPRG